MKGLMSRGSSLVVALVAASCVGITPVSGECFRSGAREGKSACRTSGTESCHPGTAGPPGAAGSGATTHGTGTRSAPSDSTAKPAAAASGRATSTATAAVKQGNAPARVQRQVQEPRQQLKQAPGSAGSAARRSQAGWEKSSPTLPVNEVNKASSRSPVCRPPTGSVARSIGACSESEACNASRAVN